jgi:hypothetical protein
MDDTAKLLAIEEIKQLMARYFYGYDHKDWVYWRDQVWAPEGRLEVTELDTVVSPRDAMIEWVAAQSADQVTVHHGHTPIIEITSDTTATGIWAMEDLLWRSLKNPAHGDVSFIHGWGHYHERYVKLDVGWRILSTRLSRLRTEYHSTGGAVTVSMPVVYGAVP